MSQASLAPHRPERSFPWLVLAIVAAGVFLRLEGLDVHDAWADEGITWAVAQSGDPIEYLRRYCNGEPPLIHALLRPLAGAGSSIEVLRLVPALFGVLGVVAWAVVLFRNVSPGAARLGVPLYALSAYQIYYAQELRVYSVLAFLGLVVFGILLEAMRRDRVQRRLWGVLALAEAAMLYAHYLAASYLVALAIAVAMVPSLRRHWRPWLLAQLGGALLFLPWLPTMFECASILRDMKLVTDFKPLRDIAAPFLIPAIGRSIVPSAASPTYRLDLGGCVAMAAVVATWVIGGAATLVRRRETALLSFLICASILPIAIVVGIALGSIPNYNYLYVKYLIWTQPALALLATLWMQGELASGRRWSVLLTLTTFLAINAWSHVNYRFSPQYLKAPAYRELTHWLRDQVRPDDAIVYDWIQQCQALDPVCVREPKLRGLRRGLLISLDETGIRGRFAASCQEMRLAPIEACDAPRTWIVFTKDVRYRKDAGFDSFRERHLRLIDALHAKGILKREVTHEARGVLVVSVVRP